MADKNKENFLARLGALPDDVIANEEITALHQELMRLRTYNSELSERLEGEREALKKQMQNQEREFHARLEKQRHDITLREESLEREFSDRSRKMEQLQRASEVRNHALIADLDKSSNDIAEAKKRLEIERTEFEKTKQRYDEEANKKLQSTSATFVGSVVTDLRKRESQLMSKSTAWSVCGGVALAIALFIASLAIYQASLATTESIPTSNVMFLLIKGTFFMGVSGIIARFAFLLSQKYLSESLRVSDIIHGVSFGQMYVQSYGATAGWDEVKEAFSKWHDGPAVEAIEEKNDVANIDVETAAVNPEILNKLFEALKELNPKST